MFLISHIHRLVRIVLFDQVQNSLVKGKRIKKDDGHKGKKTKLLRSSFIFALFEKKKKIAMLSYVMLVILGMEMKDGRISIYRMESCQKTFRVFGKKKNQESLVPISPSLNILDF